MSGFQRTVNNDNPIAVEGDFASANTRTSVLAGESALIAGLSGVTVGRFAWVAPDNKTTNSFGNGGLQPDGFVHREQGAALITQYLGETSNLIPAGFGVTLLNEGDFFVINRSGATSVKGTQVYANFADGTALVNGSTGVPASVTATGAIGATFTATGSGTNLTTSAVTGLISIGDTIAGTGVPAGTTIVSQTSGTTGGAGVYVTSAVTTASAATVTSFGNVLNVTAVSSGVLKVGDSVTGTGVPAGASINGQVSGATGGVGVYTLNIPATAYAASTTLTAPGGVGTNFYVRSVAAANDLVKISTWGKN